MRGGVAFPEFLIEDLVQVRRDYHGRLANGENFRFLQLEEVISARYGRNARLLVLFGVRDRPLFVEVSQVVFQDKTQQVIEGEVPGHHNSRRERPVAVTDKRLVEELALGNVGDLRREIEEHPRDLYRYLPLAELRRHLLTKRVLKIKAPRIAKKLFGLLLFHLGKEGADAGRPPHMELVIAFSDISGVEALVLPVIVQEPSEKADLVGVRTLSEAGHAAHNIGEGHVNG